MMWGTQSLGLPRNLRKPHQRADFSGGNMVCLVASGSPRNTGAGRQICQVEWEASSCPQGSWCLWELVYTLSRECGSLGSEASTGTLDPMVDVSSSLCLLLL